MAASSGQHLYLNAQFNNIEGFYRDGTLEEVIKEFGSMEKFITEGLGISQDEMQRLRIELLK